jgi:predicted enzyme related to lactoylglutathione lyase
MGRPVVHWELWSENPQRASEFYQRVFDWQVQHVPELNYHMVSTGGAGGINGGIMKPQEGEWPGKLAFYIDVADLASTLGRITDAGGQTILERQEIPGMGEIALFSDPDGRVLGLWKAALPAAAAAAPAARRRPAKRKSTKGTKRAKATRKAKAAKKGSGVRRRSRR